MCNMPQNYVVGWKQLVRDFASLESVLVYPSLPLGKLDKTLPEPLSRHHPQIHKNAPWRQFSCPQENRGGGGGGGGGGELTSTTTKCTLLASACRLLSIRKRKSINISISFTFNVGTSVNVMHSCVIVLNWHVSHWSPVTNWLIACYFTKLNFKQSGTIYNFAQLLKCVRMHFNKSL